MLTAILMLIDGAWRAVYHTGATISLCCPGWLVAPGPVSILWIARGLFDRYERGDGLSAAGQSFVGVWPDSAAFAYWYGRRPVDHAG
jgi:hypothetical protein